MRGLECGRQSLARTVFRRVVRARWAPQQSGSEQSTREHCGGTALCCREVGVGLADPTAQAEGSTGFLVRADLGTQVGDTLI